jgi:hypothetical protein
MVQNPLKIQEKNSKKKFFWVFNPVQNPLFEGRKIFQMFFWLHLVPGTTIEKKIKKTQVVPGTKYGVFRYFSFRFRNFFVSFP